MKKKTPLLSVIVPAYNCETYLDECLCSVLDQCGEDCEVLVVNDGSEDGTADRLSSYRNDSRVRIYFIAHQGASAARNLGLDHAAGEYVTFLDCDDCLREGFLSRSRELFRKDVDLYLFGIERVHLTGNSEFWMLQDRIYPAVCDFADAYIRQRHLLIYSNCNKFYRRSLIEEGSLRFDPGLSFGEDRLFNYRYLSRCRKIAASSLIMLRYMERSVQSMSSQHVPFFFRRVMELHQAKMKCFLSLSKGTTDEERRAFIGYDLSREVENTLNRFRQHPEEREENLPDINRLVFGVQLFPEHGADVLVVLGSRNCAYKADLACRIAERNPDILLIVSGGNPVADGGLTEAEYMADYLVKQGISLFRIYPENRAVSTRQNLELSAGVIREIEVLRNRAVRRIGIVTGGFHLKRVKALAESLSVVGDRELFFYPAYGPNTAPDNWADSELGREIILNELRKIPGIIGQDYLREVQT